MKPMADLPLSTGIDSLRRGPIPLAKALTTVVKTPCLIDPSHQGKTVTIGTKGRHKRRGFVLRAIIPQHIGDALKSRYVASENNKADMHTKRLATVR